MRGTLSLTFNLMMRDTLLLIFDSMKGMLSPVFLFALPLLTFSPDVLTFPPERSVTAM